MPARLLLLSLGLGAVPGFVRDHVAGTPRVALVPTAAAPYDDRPWVDADRQALRAMGFAVEDLDLEQVTGERLRERLAGIDVLYVAGGNTFHLLHHVRASGLDALLPPRLEEGLLYVGASAGAVVAGPDIEPVSVLDDPAEAPALESTVALGLVDEVPVPHVGGTLYPPQAFDEVRGRYGSRFRLREVRDDEALLVEGRDVRLVASP